MEHKGDDANEEDRGHDLGRAVVWEVRGEDRDGSLRELRDGSHL
jgi:hypothetical protein